MAYKITVGFSRNKNNAIGSLLIRKFMNREFSHVFFKYKEPLFEDATLFHAIGKGLVYMAENTFLSHNVVVDEFELSISQELFNELMMDCHNNAGKDYGFFQNLGIFAIRSLNKIGFNIKKNPINDGINCSEWLYYILEEIYGKWTETDPNLVAPDEVYDFLKGKL